MENCNGCLKTDHCIPCPSCGGTTAFAHFVRGQWGSALRANAASTLLAGLCVVGVPWSWGSAWQRRYLGVPDIVKTLPYQEADAIVLSACVQMPSLPAVAKVEAMTGKPVITAAIATTYALLRELDLEPVVPGAGALLSGAY